MATSPFYLKEHSDGIATSPPFPFYLQGRWDGHPFHSIYRGDGMATLSILSEGIDWYILPYSFYPLHLIYPLYLHVLSTVDTMYINLQENSDGMAISPLYLKGNGDGMATSPLYLKEHSDGIATSLFYLKGRGDGHHFHLI